MKNQPIVTDKRAAKNNKTKPKTRNTLIVSVSLEPELHEEAKTIARRYGMSISMLIRQLLRRQIADGGDLTIPAQKSEMP